MGANARIRWLGVAGIELTIDGEVLVIDPYFTRFPAWKVGWGLVQPNTELITSMIPRCDHVLVTHAHFDHVMDVPGLVRSTGAVAYGSPNTCGLLVAHGITDDHIHPLRVGEGITFGDVEIKTLESKHLRTPGFGPGPLAPRLRPPLRARDYRMDGQLTYLVSANGLKIQTDPGIRPTDAAPCDLLWVHAGRDEGYYETLFNQARPRAVVPYHWEDFFRPLSQPLRPHWLPPRWAWPPLQRVDLAQFRRMLRRLAPETILWEPEPLRSYDMEHILGGRE